MNEPGWSMKLQWWPDAPRPVGVVGAARPARSTARPGAARRRRLDQIRPNSAVPKGAQVSQQSWPRGLGKGQRASAVSHSRSPNCLPGVTVLSLLIGVIRLIIKPGDEDQPPLNRRRAKRECFGVLGRCIPSLECFQAGELGDDYRDCGGGPSAAQSASITSA
jgi:hypothetical protein